MRYEIFHELTVRNEFSEVDTVAVVGFLFPLFKLTRNSEAEIGRWLTSNVAPPTCDSKLMNRSKTSNSLALLLFEHFSLKRNCWLMSSLEIYIIFLLLFRDINFF